MKKRTANFGKAAAAIILVVLVSIASCCALAAESISGTETGTEEYITEETADKSTAADSSAAENDSGKSTDTEVKGKICLDPGHQAPSVDMSGQEPNAPSSSEMKTKSSTGTQGTVTGIYEYQLNLDIALLVKNELVNRGYEVVLTRKDNDTAISNMERAQLAADEGCDIMVRIHANGSDDSSQKGALAMTSTAANPDVGDLYEESQLLAKDILDSYCEETGFDNLGIVETDEMTGINWSTVPVMILEMGYMTNPEEDAAMQDAQTRRKMVNGIVEGIERYYHDREETDSEKDSDGQSEDITEEAETSSESEITEGTPADIIESYLAPREALGETWAVVWENPETGKIYIHNGHTVMQSASVIKVFIMAAVYDRILYPSREEKRITYNESYEGELYSLLESMITVSDNDAANRLVEILGSGDFSDGAAVVNDFCEENGYGETSLGRRFMEENPSGDNYTSALDCCTILLKIYKGTCVNEKASEEMLGLLKQQTRKNKIPAGLSEEFTSANKTGEMPEGYGLGCIENDIAIVFSSRGDYILTVLSNNLGGRNDEAISVITQISADVSRWFMEDGENGSQ